MPALNDVSDVRVYHVLSYGNFDVEVYYFGHVVNINKILYKTPQEILFSNSGI